MTEHLRNSHNAGIHRGWNAANFADAYGIDPEEGGKEKQAATISSGQTFYDSGEFLNGFREGWELFENGQWQDGSPMGDDDNA